MEKLEGIVVEGSLLDEFWEVYLDSFDLEKREDLKILVSLQ